MAKRIIECQVNDEYVLGSGVVVGAAGSHDDVVLRLAFGNMWIGLNIYATFRDSNGDSPTQLMLMPSMLVDGKAMTYDVLVPYAAKRFQGKMMLTLTGYSIVDGTEEDSATHTTTAYFRVLPSDFAGLDDGTITPSLAQQVQNELGEFGEVIKDLLENGSNNTSEALDEHIRSDLHITSAERETWNESAESIGDIETALDEIIELQEGLMIIPDGDEVSY